MARWEGSVRAVAGVAVNKFHAESVVGEVYVVDEGGNGDVGMVVDVGGNGVERGGGNTGSLWRGGVADISRRERQWNWRSGGQPARGCV